MHGAIRPSYAAIGAITKADLSGNWVITLNGNTGCGLVSMLVNVTLNTAGVGTASIQTHSISGSPSGCEGTITSQSFTIDSLNTAGTGKASLSCGVGCGWNFDIQVAPDRSIFNLVDVNPLNPNNLLNGVAIHKNN